MPIRQICSLPANPLIKWIGGKSQLLMKLRTLMPKQYNTYYEPFFGGGALFCNIRPRKSVINDINPKLINMYNSVKSDTENLIRLLDDLQQQYNNLNTLQEKETMFFRIRDLFNAEPYSTEQAAHFLFLNKTCYNGLYRTNLNNEFNSSYNRADTVNLYDVKNMYSVAQLLQTTTILNTDFEEAVSKATTNDFVFFDSPYWDTDSRYDANRFSEQDQIRLFRLAEALTETGCTVMLTNSDCDYIRQLYHSFNITQINVNRLINCDAENRTGSEVIITNY